MVQDMAVRTPTLALSLLLLAALLPFAATADIYKYVDQNGVIRYTDKPPSKDAKPVELPPVQTYTSGDAGNQESGTNAQPDSILAAEPAGYTRIALTSPSPEQVFNQSNPQVNVSVSLEPALITGHRLVFLLDGLPYPSSPGQNTIILEGLERGSHMVQAAVMDSRGAIQIQSEPVNFHLHQPSRLRPKPPGAIPKPP
jgi:hypothetical protein